MRSCRMVLALLPTVLGDSLHAMQAAPRMVTDRPDQTESAEIVPRGLLQLEAGGVHTFDRAGTGPAVRNTNVGGGLLRVGLARPVELRLGFTGWKRESIEGGGATGGLGDLGLGAKVQLVRGSGIAPTVAAVGGFVIPVGAADLRAAGVDPSVRLAVAHDLGAGLSLGYNAGASWTTVRDGTGGESVEASLLYTVVLGRQLLPVVAAFLEAFGEHGLADGADSWHALDGGVTIPLRTNLQFDFSAGVGLGEAAADWFVSAGLAVRVPR